MLVLQTQISWTVINKVVLTAIYLGWCWQKFWAPRNWNISTQQMELGTTFSLRYFINIQQKVKLNDQQISVNPISPGQFKLESRPPNNFRLEKDKIAKTCWSGSQDRISMSWHYPTQWKLWAFARNFDRDLWGKVFRWFSGPVTSQNFMFAIFKSSKILAQSFEHIFHYLARHSRIVHLL